MDKYTEYTCTSVKGKCIFTGKETVEELEKKILSENDLLEFYHDSVSLEDSFKNIKTAEDFLYHINNMQMFESNTKTKFTAAIRYFPTRFVESKKVQHIGARHGRSLADIFLIGKTVLPEMTLRELMTAYIKSGTYSICRDIRKRLMNITLNKENTYRYCTDLLTLDEFNKTIPDWCRELKIKYSLSKDVNENDKVTISHPISSRGYTASKKEEKELHLTIN